MTTRARLLRRSSGIDTRKIIRSRARPTTPPRPVLNTDTTPQAGTTPGPWYRPATNSTPRTATAAGQAGALRSASPRRNGQLQKDDANHRQGNGPTTSTGARRQGFEPRTRGLRVDDLEYRRLTIDTVG